MIFGHGALMEIVERLPAVACRCDAETLHLETIRQRLASAVIVLDNQDDGFFGWIGS